MEDKLVIDSGGWLNDRIMSAWQLLLQKKYPVGGLHSSVVASGRRWKERSHGESGVVQVLNSANSHWAAMSTVGCKPGIVHWLDSLHCLPSSQQEEIVADLLQSSEDSLQFKVINVQLQSNGNDCGLFALANITAVLEGVDPSAVYFNTQCMRAHLRRCLIRKDPRMFPRDPTKELPRPFRIVHTYKVDIYCVCRLLDNGHVMILCAKCNRWFHKRCTTLNAKSDSAVKKINWKCLECQ